MLRTTAIATILFTACADAPPPTEAHGESSQPEGAACGHILHPCNPSDWGSESYCTWACGHTAHCRDYTLREELYCADHPNQVLSLSPLRWCSKWGNPTWNTWCVSDLLASPAPNPSL